MAGSYEIWLTTDAGLRLQSLDIDLWLNATRVVNGIGSFSMGLPRTFDTRLIQPDRMIQVWRAPQGGRLSLWRPYFIRKWRYETVGAQRIITLTGPDANDLLRRRIVAAYAESTQAAKTDFADDMMKEIVTEAIADGVAPVPAAGTRVWTNFTIQADASAGPTLTRGFSWQKLSRLIVEIANAAREAGTEVFFDIVTSSVDASSISFEFRTYVGQPGQDRTVTGMVFDQMRGNLRNPFLEYDHTAEENYIYSGGQGQAAGRNVQQVYSTIRYDMSQWNRCEGFANAQSQTTNNGVREIGRARLESGRPRRRFGAEAIDTRGTRFGRDWNHGDLVRARYEDEEFDSIVRVTNIGLEPGRETIAARLEYED